jgi:hypothetical protein
VRGGVRVGWVRVTVRLRVRVTIRVSVRVRMRVRVPLFLVYSADF